MNKTLQLLYPSLKQTATLFATILQRFLHCLLRLRADNNSFPFFGTPHFPPFLMGVSCMHPHPLYLDYKGNYTEAKSNQIFV